MGDTFHLIAREAVAGMLGMTVDKFYHRLRDLQANPLNPFPGPTLGRMSGARWDPRAIERWIAAGGEHATPDTLVASTRTAPKASAPDADNDDHADELDRRAAEIAAGAKRRRR